MKQFIHWDAHYWQKHQFFFLIQSAFILGAGKLITDEVYKCSAANAVVIPVFILWLALALSILNLFLCYVWLKTSKRNRLYLKSRIHRAKELENEIKPLVMKSFNNPMLNHIADGSVSKLENNVPKAFMGLWSIIFTYFLVLISRGLCK